MRPHYQDATTADPIACHRAPPTQASELAIGGLTPLTTIDYPGELAAVVFCQGCPWRCRYCHNGHLLSRRTRSGLNWDDVFGFLIQRRGLLDAVVFSGGEPTAQAALGPALRAARGLGYLIGLHTSGAYPNRLGNLLPELDWVGLDIKAMPDDYPATTGVADSGSRAWESLDRLRSAGTAFTVRITVHDRLLPAGRLESLLDRLDAAGIEAPAIQVCSSQRLLDPSLGPNGYRRTGPGQGGTA